MIPASIRSASIFLPLQQRRFRRLWLANLVSNLGAWGQSFAAAWHVATLGKSAALPALVQTATWAPMLLLALPAGVLADRMHRPTLLFRSNAAMCLTSAAMAGLTMAGVQSALLMLALTFVMAIGTAFTLPAWQVSMSELVPKEHIAAVVSLNNLSYNAAALAGPLFGGLMFNLSGPASLYLFNALSFCGLLWLYWRWREDASPMREAPRQRAAGLAAAWQSVRYRRLLYHAAYIFCASTAFAALLPSLVRDVQHGNADAFGTQMGALGGGAMFAAVLLPGLRRRLAPRVILAAALLFYGGMLGLLGVARSQAWQFILIACGGIGWSAMVGCLNSAALSAFPLDMRPRTLSIYIFMVAAGQTAGGILWGQLAAIYGSVPVMAGAGACLAAGAVAILISNDFLEYQ